MQAQILTPLHEFFLLYFKAGRVIHIPGGVHVDQKDPQMVCSPFIHFFFQEQCKIPQAVEAIVIKPNHDSLAVLIFANWTHHLTLIHTRKMQWVEGGAICTYC